MSRVLIVSIALRVNVLCMRYGPPDIPVNRYTGDSDFLLLRANRPDFTTGFARYVNEERAS
jgi:hypothetical protein